jgi:hypothetical protein
LGWNAAMAATIPSTKAEIFCSSFRTGITIENLVMKDLVFQSKCVERSVSSGKNIQKFNLM